MYGNAHYIPTNTSVSAAVPNCHESERDRERVVRGKGQVVALVRGD